jgi:hypothetical protein
MEYNTMQDFFTAISNFGFPVVVAGYLLIRIEKKIEDLTNVITRLSLEMSALSEEVKRKRK